jgi:type II secretory pathway pseudopilin PulG
MELLVAISLLSLLSVGMVITLRVGLNGMEKANAKLMANRRVVSVERIMRSQIAGLIPVSADCVAAPDQPPQRIMYFEGLPQSMRFVSSYSLEEASRGMPRILEFQVIPGEQGQGVRLVVNETVYSPQAAGASCYGVAPDPQSGLLLPRFRPIPVGPGSFVLADKLSYCRFSYRQIQPPPVLARWLPEWPPGRWPTAIQIEMAPLEQDPSRVPLASIVAQVHVNRLPMEFNGQ